MFRLGVSGKGSSPISFLYILAIIFLDWNDSSYRLDSPYLLFLHIEMNPSLRSLSNLFLSQDINDAYSLNFDLVNSFSEYKKSSMSTSADDLRPYWYMAHFLIIPQFLRKSYFVSRP